MDRRSFLRFLGVGVAAVAVAPKVVEALVPSTSGNLSEEGGICPISEPEQICQSTDAVIAQYADYANFSDLKIASALDAAVSETARQLGYQAGLSINSLYQETFKDGLRIDSTRQSRKRAKYVRFQYRKGRIVPTSTTQRSRRTRTK